MSGVLRGFFRFKLLCWKTCLSINTLEIYFKISEKMFCNMLAEMKKVRTFATLSRGKRTKEYEILNEYDILKNIVKFCFSIALKIFLKEIFKNICWFEKLALTLQTLSQRNESSSK